MRVIAFRTLREFYEQPRYGDSERQLKAWYRVAKSASWGGPADIKRVYRHASIIDDRRVVFNIAGNKYRLVVWVDYIRHGILIRWIGPHGDYDRLDVTTV